MHSLSHKIVLLTFIFSLCSVTTWPASGPLDFIHYTTEDGLSSSYVKGIQQDKYGFIWIATREDMCRFEGNRFVRFPAKDLLGQPTQIMPFSIKCVGDTLILCETIENYFYYFDYHLECFKPFIPLYNNIKKTDICSSGPNELAYIQDKKIYQLDIKSGHSSFHKAFLQFGNSTAPIGAVKLASNQDYLVVATTSNELYLLEKATQKIIHIGQVDKDMQKQVEFLNMDSGNNIWYAFSNEGLFRMSSNLKETILFSETSSHRISHNLIHCVTLDHDNNAWIGTENGLCIWNEKTGEIAQYQYDRMNPDGLNTNPIYNAFTDKQGNVWLGTYFGGINLWSCKEPKFRFWKAGSSKNHLGGKVVSCFAEDLSGNLWIGTEDMAINKLNPLTGEIEKVNESLSQKTLTYDNVHHLLFVTPRQLWVATYSGGINILDVPSGKVSLISTKSHQELGSDFVYAFTMKDQTIYIGTSVGMATYDVKTKQIKRFHEQELLNQEVVSFAWQENILWFCSYTGVFSYDLANDKLIRHTVFREEYGFNQIYCDKQKNVWVSTSFKGLIQYHISTREMTFHNKNTDFPANRIFAFQPDDDGTFWISTNVGLVNFDAQSKRYVLYDSNSGVPFNQFNYRAAFKDQNGQIYFGGNDGMIAINKPALSAIDSVDLEFTEFLLFNKHVEPGNDSPLPTSISRCNTIELEYRQNVFTFLFSAINYSQKGHILYAYRMEGFEDEFNYVGNRNSATYTNLNPGEYVFRVKTSMDAWRTESAEKSIKIIINPPFWRTQWAILIYTLLLLAGILLFHTISVKIQKTKALMALERQERIHAEQINQFKMDFFTHISHEIKTPLSLILGPLSTLIEEEEFTPAIQQKIKRIYVNVKRLHVLLSELLEFRKMEKNTVSLQVQHITSFEFIHNIEETFKAMAQELGILFHIDSRDPETDMWFNSNMVEKILFNLLSNAFKYCKTGSSVSLTILPVATSKSESDHDINLKIIVNDNGPGISPDELTHIFDLFYQTPSSKEMAVGTGIGLSYVKSLVELHRGTIKVESQPGKGTHFYIELPASKNQFHPDEIKETESILYFKPDYLETIQTPKLATDPEIYTTSSDLPKVLVIEDNPELSAFIKETLADTYQVILAENGRVGYEKTTQLQPELIISDVMMPEMDGFEFTQKVKSNILTSHIPVILLTAKGGVENQYEGLLCGADLYIEKPFFPLILKQNIANLLNTRRSMAKRFASDPQIAPSEVAYSAHDKEFIEHLTQIVILNIDNPNVDVSFLIGEMHVSRSLIHLKLKNLLNCSTTEFIRMIRLRKAVELIHTEKCNIAEAAYRTGFSSPAYFSRAFKDYYGKSPRQYFNLSE